MPLVVMLEIVKQLSVSKLELGFLFNVYFDCPKETKKVLLMLKRVINDMNCAYLDKHAYFVSNFRNH